MIDVKVHIKVPGTVSWWKKLLWWFRRKHYKIEMPEAWDEVTEKTFWKLMKHHVRRHSMSEYAFQVLLLRDLLNLPWWLLTLLPKDMVADQIVPKIAWAANLEFSKSITRIVQIGGEKWHLPDQSGEDMTVQQYFLLEESFFKLFSENREESAAEFLAAFLRPFTYSFSRHYEKTGMLPTVSQVQLKQYAQRLEKASPEQVVFLVHFYGSFRQYIRGLYPKLFEKSGEKDTESEIDWRSIPPQIAESGVFGTLQDVLSTPVLSYFAWANARHQNEKTDQPQNLQDIIRLNHQKMLN
jgi:hypothetical protein